MVRIPRMAEAACASKVLVVSEDYQLLVDSIGTLRAWGFRPITCPGPNVSPDCPRLTGQSCPLRESAEVALVDVDPYGVGERFEVWSERVCTTLPDDGRTCFAVRGAGPTGRPIPWDGCEAAPATLTEDALVALVEERLEPVARQRLALAKLTALRD